MFKIGIYLILHGLLLGIKCHPKQHHVIGRSGVQTRPNHMQNDLKAIHHNRDPRDIHLLKLKDPLDCLSQVVCGLNTYPPQKPSVRTSTANDFAFLLKNSIAKLRSQKQATTTTTTTTTPPSTKRSTTKAPLDDEDEDYDSESGENDVDYEADEVEEYYDAPPPIDRRSGYNRMKRYSIFNNRRGEPSKKNKKQSKKNGKSAKRSKVKLRTSPYDQYFKKQRVQSNKPSLRPLTPLERLRMETDLRAKLLSFAQCPDVGLIDHSCPFNYQQMLVLISSSLERERTISYTANKVLPMVGYLIKSRNYTGTLQSTFTAIERINNYTIDNDRQGKPIDFTHILDEVMNRVTGDAGLRIVDTSNDSASASVWEDDEFDHVLQNPYERRRPQSDNYKLDKKRKEAELKKKQKQKLAVKQADDQSTTSEEDTSEEGLIFDRPRHRPRPPNGSGGDGESSSEEEEEDERVNKVLLEIKKKEEEKRKKEEERKQKMQIKVTKLKKTLKPLPVFGHLQKSADDE